MIQGWLTAAAVALCWRDGRRRPRGGGVSVEGNRFYRDGAPWVAEGVTLVARALARGSGAGPTYAAARAAFGPGMLGEVERYGADLVRFQVSQAGARPEIEGLRPGYRDDVLDADRPDPGGRAQRHRLDAMAGRRRAPTRAACRRRRPGAPGASSAPRSPTTAASCSRSSTSRR